MKINKPIFSTFIILWASLDLPTLGGMLIFSAGLGLAAYIWVRWGSPERESCQEERV